MRNRHDEGTLRRYVLGTSTAEEVEKIETAYFERADVLEQLSAVEEELIEDYLSGRLEPTEPDQFERHYLPTPTHRRRVAVMRGLRNASKTASSPIVVPRATNTAVPAAPARHPKSIPGWWALAASLVLLVGSGTWLLWPDRAENTIAVQDQRPSSTPTTQAPTVAEAVPRQPTSPSRGSSPSTASTVPVVVAVTISPILVRSAGEPSPVVIAKGTDILRLQLRGQEGERLHGGRSVIRTVDGHEVWRGPVTAVPGSPRQLLARVDVPAPALRPDDYIVELFDTDNGGREVERHRYFLRVRVP